MTQTLFHALGSKIALTIDGDTAELRAALRAARGWFLDWEARFSRFSPESELSQLNRRAGQETTVSDEFWRVLRAALRAAEWSGGLANPAILPALEDAGYDRPFAQVLQGRAAADAPRDALPTASMTDNWRAIQLFPRRRSVRLPEGMRLDLGGFAKGWAADQAAQRLSQLAATVVDAGGDIAIRGRRADGTDWRIGVAGRREGDPPLAILQLHSGGVATSGRNFRRWMKDGVAQHHLIDPRRRKPAETDVLSATVIVRRGAGAALRAETAAKVALILGSQEGAAWLQARKLPGLLALEDGSVIKV